MLDYGPKMAVTSSILRSIPEQANISTITSALSSVPNTCIKAPTVVYRPNATLMSSTVESGSNPNAA